MPKNKPIVHLVSDDEAKGDAKKLFETIEKTSGKVPKWMRVMANCDDTLLGFFSLFKSLMDNAPTDQKLKWKIAYIVSEINKCDFCVDVSKLKLKEFGLEEKEMKDIEKTCNEAECIAIDYAKEVTKHAYKIDQNLIKNLKKHFSDEQIVEITAVVGLFNFINRFNDALGILPEIK